MGAHNAQGEGADMKYLEFLNKQSFGLEDLLAFSYGKLVDDPPEDFSARLPAPPFLMIDRITLIEGSGRGGFVKAEMEVKLDAWYFQCHMPGTRSNRDAFLWMPYGNSSPRILLRMARRPWLRPRSGLRRDFIQRPDQAV